MRTCGRLARARGLLHKQVGGGDDRQGEDEAVEQPLVHLPREAATDQRADDDRRR